MKGGSPELLAPAGTIAAGLAAFDAGADAVYAGLSSFNARERGQNFTFEELSKLIAWAHKLKRKVYVTLNTLIKESELIQVASILAELSVIRPDAVIVQDIGVVRMIREFFPELTMHASTQMGIHNSAGARMAKRMGMARVILERQVTYEEIAEIGKNTSIELEVFVHGALCCGRSGACLFSSWMGGWSGNRGKCKQPCRRRYHTAEGNGFFFSPRDLYALDAVEELKALGVSCLKIEGRLRRADYVNHVVSAYRMMLDHRGTLKEAKAVLAQALGRKWQPAFRKEGDLKGVIQHKAIGAAGLLCGKVVQASPKGFLPKGFLVEVSRPLGLNDTIRVQPAEGDEGPAFTITRMAIDGKNVSHAKKGQSCWVHFDKPVALNAWVYKTGVEPLDVSKRVEGLPLAKPVLDLEIRLDDRSATITSGTAVFRTPMDLQPAKSHPMNPEQVEEEFRKSGAGKYAAGTIQVRLVEERFLPASRLKELRRAFWTWADEQVQVKSIEDRLAETETGYTVSGSACETTIRLSGKKKNPRQGTLTARSIGEYTKDTDEVVLPEFCPEFDLPGLREGIARVTAQGARRFRVTSLFGFDLLEDYKDLELTASFPLPACNSYAAAELYSRGASKATAWVELEEQALESLLARCKGFMEVFAHGRIPVLSTRLDLPASGEITDHRGARFELTREEGLAWLYPEKVLSLPVPQGTSAYLDLTHADLHESSTDALNYFRDFA